MVGEAKAAISGGTMSSDERSHQGEDLRSTEERLLAEPIVSDIELSDKEMVGEAKAAISGGMIPPNNAVPMLKQTSGEFRMLLQNSELLIRNASGNFGSNLARESLKRLYSNFQHIFRSH